MLLHSIPLSSIYIIPIVVMKRKFVEAKDFTEKIEEIGEKNLLQTIQNSILKDTEIGVLIQGTGGLRKFRVGAKGKGKSGGIRVFYLDIPTKEECYLLFILEKSESENISAQEKKELRNFVKLLKS